ncbi:hypothetical protein MKX08_005429 [Trichoderma sp. CBMAI-0020]|nr:hypothetical protein MKX08_005429 [Trichoderma sp. CBMAI-0020]
MPRMSSSQAGGALRRLARGGETLSGPLKKGTRAFVGPASGDGHPSHQPPTSKIQGRFVAPRAVAFFSATYGPLLFVDQQYSTPVACPPGAEQRSQLVTDRLARSDLESIFSLFYMTWKYSVILLGLDNAGKTTFHEQVKSMFLPNAPEPKLKTVPTVGQNVSTITLPDMYLKLWDVGGQHSLRKLWQSYYASCHAIVFIIDSTDIGDGDLAHENIGRLDECRLVLEDVLQHSETEGVPLLILANKQDREDCVETIRIKEGLVKRVMEGEKGSAIRDSRVLAMSALTGDGVREAIDWVRSRVQWNKESRPPVMR